LVEGGGLRKSDHFLSPFYLNGEAPDLLALQEGYVPGFNEHRVKGRFAFFLACVFFDIVLISLLLMPRWHLKLIESVETESRNKRTRGVYAQGLVELEQELTSHLVRAELEKIIWGETSAETAPAIERLGREIGDLVRAKREEAERREEERKRREIDSQ
jgi:hypothetical protein